MFRLLQDYSTCCFLRLLLLHCCAVVHNLPLIFITCFMLVQALVVFRRGGERHYQRQYHFFLFFRRLVDAFSYSVCLARILLWFISTQPSGMTEAV
ncbi:Uncharacterised protein [Serratia quinivorans]|nr:Uncharacterised protein [Serratia quinivorans]